MSAPAHELDVFSRYSESGHDGHRQCPLCRGDGAGIMHGERFLHWELRIDGFVIFLRKLKSIVDAIINIALVLAVLAGGLLMWRHVSAAEPATVLTVGFWHTPHPSLLA